LIDVRPDGTTAYVLEIDRVLYRSYRVKTLYEGTDEYKKGPFYFPTRRESRSPLGAGDRT
jgi:hypothetical protein